jgi:xanthine dehydrogenase YagR molybdenum-binding subunit
MSERPSRCPRVDAHDKVRGAILFGADHRRADMLHAALAIATIAKGRITSLDTGRQRRSAFGLS